MHPRKRFSLPIFQVTNSGLREKTQKSVDKKLSPITTVKNTDFRPLDKKHSLAVIGKTGFFGLILIVKHRVQHVETEKAHVNRHDHVVIRFGVTSVGAVDHGRRASGLVFLVSAVHLLLLGQLVIGSRHLSNNCLPNELPCAC